MAQKEASIYIVDVGKSMGEKHNGREETDLDWSMRYVWDKITTAVSTGRKTLHAGVLGLRTDESNNPSGDEEGYNNISILQPIGQVLMSHIRDLKDVIKPSNTEEGDAISALIIAIQMMAKHCKHLKYEKHIYLVTNGRGAYDDDLSDDIIKKVKEDGIQLTVLGVDFDEAEYGFKEENKDVQKAENENILRNITEGCGGAFGTMEEAISQLGIPRVKSTRPTPLYKGVLTLGDPQKYDTAISIDVQRYARVRVARPPTSSAFVVRQNMAPGESQAQSSVTMGNGDANGDVQMTDADGLVAVKNARTYEVEDKEAPGGKKDVAFDDLAKGYEYGRTAVAISESDMNVTELETFQCLDIIGFIPRDKYERYFSMSETNIIIPNPINSKAAMALSSLIHALWEVDSYAIARFVRKDNTHPLILLLMPYFEVQEDKKKFECLVDVELPFAEDLRQYKFPPLDRVVTVSGKSLTQHRNLPSEGLRDAMDSYVDAMDLSKFDTDDEGKPAEYAAIEDTYSPIFHYINQAIRLHAIHPEDPIPAPYDILTKYSHPPVELLEKAQSHLGALKKAADVKPVPKKPKYGRGRKKEVDKPQSGLDIDALLRDPSVKRPKISAENAVPEFKQHMAAITTDENADADTAVHSAAKDLAEQMATHIEGYIKHSVGESGYGRAIEALRVMREELIDLDEPVVYNDVLRRLKGKIFDGELGGDRREMWYKIRVNKVGIVDKRMQQFADVTEEEAKEFMLMPKA
ncbi:putative Ku family DNA helicase [Rhizodiscina lignyota]|uniref:ATP-dependent DNA helicase II subunit 2 n=1 Tax=Rhizodiscina lignyota TaxID=1504668 RepID=A0A9P4IHY1_9PEZI|nr:putative Ku family DNA helicase [Rhizodiscina lignyota]